MNGYQFGLPASETVDSAFIDEQEKPIRLELGAQAVVDSRIVSEQLERLQVWEDQLQTYSDQLAETGWKSWKQGAMTSVMQELRGKVVPDKWRESAQRADERATALEERVAMTVDKERALLTRIDELENGAGVRARAARGTRGGRAQALAAAGAREAAERLQAATQFGCTHRQHWWQVGRALEESVRVGRWRGAAGR